MRGRRITALMHGWHLWTIAPGLVALAAVCPALPHVLRLPHVTPDQIATPVTVIAAWGVSLLALLTGHEPAPEIFATAPRRTHLVNLARVLAVLVVGVLLITATSRSGVLTPAAAGASFAGTALAWAGLLGLSTAWLAPTLHLLACITLGNVNRVDGLAAWAWPLDEHPGPGQLSVSAVLLWVGAALWLGSLRRPGSTRP
jgi:preprotein translocase subunit SecG